MNVVFFGKGFGKPRQYSLSGLSAGVAAAAVIGLVVSAGFAIGSWHAQQNGSGISNSELASLHAQIESQRDSIKTIRQENEDTLDALSIRIAQMNARVIRLDALGRRLTEEVET